MLYQELNTKNPGRMLGFFIMYLVEKIKSLEDYLQNRGLIKTIVVINI
ncbi:hypothetical protein SAMN05421643_1661 [Acinetobacter kyonggiensis]|uniref:Uncharacterized protein n=1 Tax=Acinetobacter kyonggiensis TaxID=595670 RepID=A0A1H3NTB8_9GAMM|nr:hypothetical protein SAMN05421643_1661 [Acinetobacter kyonggiensis]